MNMGESLTHVPYNLRYVFKQRLQPTSARNFSRWEAIVAAHTSRVIRTVGIKSLPPPPHVTYGWYRRGLFFLDLKKILRLEEHMKPWASLSNQWPNEM